MRRLSLLGILLLAACSAESDPENEPDPLSPPPVLLETDPPASDPTAPVAGDHHAWPRQATRLVWEFFEAHPLAH